VTSLVTVDGPKAPSSTLTFAQSALNLAAATLRHIAGTDRSIKRI
jgi:hypothetical protein